MPHARLLLHGRCLWWHGRAPCGGSCAVTAAGREQTTRRLPLPLPFRRTRAGARQAQARAPRSPPSSRWARARRAQARQARRARRRSLPLPSEATAADLMPMCTPLVRLVRVRAASPALCSPCRCVPNDEPDKSGGSKSLRSCWLACRRTGARAVFAGLNQALCQCPPVVHQHQKGPQSRQLPSSPPTPSPLPS